MVVEKAAEVKDGRFCLGVAFIADFISIALNIF